MEGEDGGGGVGVAAAAAAAPGEEEEQEGAEELPPDGLPRKLVAEELPPEHTQNCMVWMQCRARG